MSSPEFAIVPRWLSLSPLVTAAHRDVYAYLAWLASPGTECHPALDTIAAGANVSRRTVTRAVDVLAAVGAIQVVTRGAGRRSSRYRVFRSPLNAVAVPQHALFPVDNSPQEAVL